MARYDYRCTSCGTIFEIEHGMLERPEVHCPSCDAVAEKVFSPSGIEFKGSGFYNTDQRGGSSSTAATSGATPSDTKCACEGCPHKDN